MASGHITIIGGGLGGLIAAIKLKEAGRAFTLFEKNPKVGGTWYENAYPGCACDVPVALYQLSFAPSILWSRFYPQAAEIQAYTEELVERYSLGPDIRLSEGVRSADWDPDSKSWTVVSESGDKMTSRAVIGALGQLNRPALPDIEGRETFKGPAIH
ncbi:MAG: NAD(P)/FAD-dependent oxidoreductase, partial [Pseudomonadota bacterium]